jgi:hypothetical protein
LAEETFLDDDFLRQLMSVGEVDLIVAIPSYNNADAIGRTVAIIEEGLQQNFVRDRVAILNVDGGSSDNTSQMVLQKGLKRNPTREGPMSLRTVHRVSSRYAASPSPGLAVRAVLAAADLLRARSCAVISPTTTNATASWIVNLLRPVYREHLDFVAPLYARDRYRGLLARNLLYPMSRAIFGRRIREVYAEEWAFSGRLASECLEQNVWHEQAVRARPEAWMAVNAMCGDFKCGQSFLGPKRPPAAGTGPDIVEAIRQTVGHLFWCLEVRQPDWLERTGSQSVATFGPDHELSMDGQPASQEKIFQLFRNGVTELDPILRSILTAGTHADIKTIAAAEQEKFRFETELWVRTLYEFAAAYHHSVLNRDHLVQALVPLYRGRLYSYLREHADSSSEEMEADSEALCLEFERQKPYLLERWKGKAEVKS